MAAWSDGIYRIHRGHVFRMDHPIGASYSNTRVSFTEPTTRADGPVRDGAPHFASQHGRALALKDRLYGDRVAHE